MQDSLGMESPQREFAHHERAVLVPFYAISTLA